jgi:hypothetical protein
MKVKESMQYDLEQLIVGLRAELREALSEIERLKQLNKRRYSEWEDIDRKLNEWKILALAVHKGNNIHCLDINGIKWFDYRDELLKDENTTL